MRTRVFVMVLVLECLALVGVVIRDGSRGAATGPEAGGGTNLVKALLLTDLALWTEARYTRHPSQADRFAAFQNAPGAPDHSPAGTWVPPPWGLREGPARPGRSR